MPNQLSRLNFQRHLFHMLFYKQEYIEPEVNYPIMYNLAVMNHKL
jgi:hypothetical protein